MCSLLNANFGQNDRLHRLYELHLPHASIEEICIHMHALRKLCTFAMQPIALRVLRIAKYLLHS